MAIRLLLVEFINSDRFCQYRSEMFPFVQGWCTARGIPLRWVGYGFVPRDLPTSPLLMVLPDDEAASLCAEIRAFRPTHVLLNERLDEPLASQVREAAGAAKVEDASAVSDLWPEIWYLRDLERWLDIPAAEREDTGPTPRCLADVAVPDYSCELLSPLAREIKPFVHVIAGAPCLYHTPIQCVPEFADMDLSGAVRSFGCTFCTGGADARYFYTETPLIELALRQIRRACETLPPERRGGEFLLLGTLLFLRMKPFFAAVTEAGIPPSHFFFWCRIDELARRAALLDEVLPRISAAHGGPGHVVNIWNIGVENFSPAENQRFNKGIDLDEVERAWQHIVRWERDFPDAFRFSVHGGFGYILFTPWTTIADLRLNLEKAERYGVNEGSLFFYSRLQLFRGLPIAMLAERDGLTAPAFDAPEFAHVGAYVAKLSEDQQELPWRFADPRVAALFGLFIRLDVPWKRGLFDADEPFARLQTLRRRRLPPALRNVYRFLAVVLDVAEAHPDVHTVAELLALVETRLAPELLPEELPQTAPAEPEPTPLDRLRRALEERTRELLRLLETNPRRLLRGFETAVVTSRAEADAWEVQFELRRGDERLGVRFLPRAAAPHAFKLTPHFAVMHDEATPADTEERRQLLDVLARAVERYVARVVT